MHFGLNDQQRGLQEAARKFVRAELPDLARELERDDKPVPDDMLRRYGELGFLGINLPEQYGGMGLSHFDALLVLEEFAQVSVAVAFPVFEALTGPVRTIAQFGSDALKAKILPEVIRGEKIVAVAMSEPNAGTALTDLTTTATIDGDTIVLNGQKRWSSGAGHSHYYITYCRFDGIEGAKGIGAVVVEKGADGLSFGKPEELMGFRGVPSADIFLDDVRVPARNLIIGAGGFGKLMTAFGLERCGNATMGLGVAAGALEDALAYTQEREAFGKPIVDFQAVQMKLAEMAMQVDAARLLIWRAAANAGAQDNGGLPTVYESSLAKCFSNEMVRDVTQLGVQVMGGYGYSKEYPMEQRLRDGFAWGIAGGTTDVQKSNITAAMIGRRFNQRAK
ncbi:acyl-CoA dehydrogenase family protein [Pontixanthobacter aestiaquae]|uniref:Acyl-CoA dehydrogenase n=1 Tax=Pontixanthobacter aestiaquae TaxID=1509367 RepID=A0A844Z248_9SPHN|nr:acyl-CoA dehydrogenase family protein [Pontixanthobacter aestiaquae]MDN3647007.1 acyl-CoA dehydrogenase family protein [Pontixanthobacter aestiaquae]MXO82015.1 acyl-CoA dehydrogenase [Pontixanthobacter aestiaquae]